ncbi:hypothetical protein ACHQM5_013010 [Ranunculus cassubicifolius]
MGIWETCWGDGVIPFAAMVAVEAALVGVSTLTKEAMSRGMNRYVFVVYYNALGTLILLPTFIFQRRRHPITFSILSRFFLLGLIGYGVIMSYTGIDFSSPTLSSALNNLVPAFTFILAYIFRMEKIDVRSKSSQAKILGTIISITGAITVTLYKGHPIITNQPHSLNNQLILLSPKSNWVIGGFFITADCVLSAVGFIFQAAVVKAYPSETTITFFYCFFATIISAIFTLVAERDLGVWRLKADIEFIAIVYAALVGAALSTAIHTWCLRIKGPIYVCNFKPFGIVVAVVMGVIILKDALYIGSVIGSIVISIGFYAVMWGKSEEEKSVELSRLGSSPQAPLLGSNQEINSLMQG